MQDSRDMGHKKRERHKEEEERHKESLQYDWKETEI